MESSSSECAAAGAAAVTPGGFAEALQKAKQFAAKLQSGGMKRPYEGSGDNEPEAKKMLSPGADGEQRTVGLTDPGRAATAAQIAAAKASQINAKLGISGAAAPSLPELTQPTVSETMTVPDHMVGLLIGKGGEQIAALQSETQCMIQFASEGGKPERVCTLTGTANAVAKGKEAVSRLVQKFRNAGPNPSYGGGGGGGSVGGGGDESLGVLEMMVPGSKVGLIIGKGGETIKMLMETTGTKIVVVQDSRLPTTHDKPVTISGDRNSCQRAKEKILDLLVDRDLQLYGGPGGYKTTLEFPVPRSMVGVIIGKGGEMIKQIQDESGSRVQFKPEDDNGGPFRICTVIGEESGNRVAENMIKKLVESGMQRQNEDDVRGGGPRPDDHASGNYGQNTTSYPIPAEKCGLVIGKGGETIREINRVSGAHVELDRNSCNNPMERLFRIRGSPEQIQHAIQLICEKIGIPPNNGHGFPGPMGGPMHRPMGGPMGGPGPFGPPAPHGVLPHQPGMPYQQPMHQQPPQEPQHPGMMPGQQGWNPGYSQPQQPPPQYGTQPIMSDPTKTATDPNAAAWAAYYAQFYGQPAVPGGQPAPQPSPVQTQQPAVYSAGAPMPPASAAAAPAQRQPTINPQTGQPDYSAAWAEYYRQMGMHQHAAAIMQTMQPQAQ